MYYKSFLILVFLVLFGSYPDHVTGQTTSDKRRPETNIRDPKNPADSLVTIMPAAKALNAEAMELYREGTKLTEAGQFSQAVENFQQALRLDPEYADAYSALGRVQFKMRQWQEAAVNLRRAIELRAKQRALQDAPYQKELTRESKEVSTQVTGAPKSPQIRQEANANVATVKPLRSEPEKTRPRRHSEISAPAQHIPTTAQTKLPKETNGNDTAVKRANQESQTTLQPQQKNELSIPAQANAKSPKVILPQGNSSSAAGVKLPSASSTTRQPQQRNEVSTPAQLSSTTPKAALPQGNSGNIAGVNPPIPEPQMRPTQQRNEVSTPSQPVPANPQVTLPQQANGTVVGVKPPSPEPQTTRQPQKQNEVSTAAQLSSTTQQATLPQGNSGSVVGVNPPIPEPRTTRQLQQLNAVSTPSQTVRANLQVKLPQYANGTVVSVNPPIPEPQTTLQPQQLNAVSTPSQPVPANPQVTLPQYANGNVVGLNPPIPELEPTREPKPTADRVASLESNSEVASDQKRKPESVSVSMPVSAPAALATTNASPVSRTTPSDETSLTSIYRIGPSDVLDVRINDSQTSQSTLFTVTPTGLLELPMLPESLTVTGLTEEEIRAKIENELSKRGLLDNPKIAIGVRDYASHTILVSGLVQDPGTKILKREAIPLFVVVADAQPLPEASRVRVRRTEPHQVYEIDLNRAADMDFLIRTGDVITLHPSVTQFVYIGGEVKLPGEKTFRGGLTLTQAIIMAGGITPKSKVAEIGRDDGHGFLVGTRFTLKDIHSGKAIDPILKPGDRVMIMR
jgi:hypothetical protein